MIGNIKGGKEKICWKIEGEKGGEIKKREKPGKKKCGERNRLRSPKGIEAEE